MEKICIKVPEIFDWVRKRIELPVICFDELGHDQHSHSDHHGCCVTDDPCRLLQNGKAMVECLLTDAKGRPLNPTKTDSFLCSADIVEGKDVIGILPSGEKTKLRKVKITIQGFIVIEILNLFGFPLCTSNPIPFSVTESFFVCAPQGTEGVCEVTFFKCEAHLVCSEDQCFERLDIAIVLCTDVYTTAMTKVELEAELCEIREDIPPELLECPPIEPPSPCSALFPLKKTPPLLDE